ncbi:unnamed protein product [Sphenostylis stenocarpa]|uniref:Uncharacterized protein n=1 Tax=Sphenostylis stenocarpa TaxID=92480 RepID=A0AA86RZK0_9FABA|nr:unnamed protein product [Sphenostylis stenocarpa]
MLPETQAIEGLNWNRLVLQASFMNSLNLKTLPFWFCSRAIPSERLLFRAGEHLRDFSSGGSH